MQDHDLVILPEAKYRFFLGYSRTVESGAGISTLPDFTPTSALPLFSNVFWLTNEFRVGNELHFGKLVLNWLHGWQDFKDDTSGEGANAATSPIGGALTTLRATGPNHGTSPYWRVNLMYGGRVFQVSGRFTYAGGRRAYADNESVLGSLSLAGLSRQVVSYGNAQRPAATGNLNVSVSPIPRLSVVNQTSVYNIRIEGDNAYAEVDGTQATQFFFFGYLGIRTVANRTQLGYQLSRHFTAHAGYDYSNRRIRSVQQFAFGGPAAATPYDQTNRTNAGLFGIAFNGMKGLTASLDAEVGRASFPLAPKSPADYHAGAARIRYRLRTLQFGAFSQVDYNNNSVSLSAYSSHARTYSATASWSLREWISLDAAYTKSHVETTGAIAYFAGPQLVTGNQSLYVSNLHSGTLGVHFSWKKIADVFIGYSIVEDTGDGRASSGLLPAFQQAQTFPMRYQSPLGRISWRLAEKLRLNIGYQRYGYREAFFPSQNFGANTGYAALQSGILRPGPSRP